MLHSRNKCDNSKVHLRPPRGVHEVNLLKLLTLYHLSKVITNLCDWYVFSCTGCVLSHGVDSVVKMGSMDPPWWP